MHASLHTFATGVQEQGPCTATRCMVMTTQMIAMVTAHMLLGLWGASLLGLLRMSHCMLVWARDAFLISRMLSYMMRRMS